MFTVHTCNKLYSAKIFRTGTKETVISDLKVILSICFVPQQKNEVNFVISSMSSEVGGLGQETNKGRHIKA